jgi:hypothetical protein
LAICLWGICALVISGNASYLVPHTTRECVVRDMFMSVCFTCRVCVAVLWVC